MLSCRDGPIRICANGNYRLFAFAGSSLSVTMAFGFYPGLGVDLSVSSIPMGLYPSTGIRLVILQNHLEDLAFQQSLDIP